MYQRSIQFLARCFGSTAPYITVVATQRTRTGAAFGERRARRSGCSVLGEVMRSMTVQIRDVHPKHRLRERLHARLKLRRYREQPAPFENPVTGCTKTRHPLRVRLIRADE